MKLFVLIVSVFLVNSCGSSKAKENNQSYSIPTEKHKVVALGSNINLPDDLTIVFNLENNSVGGFNGCNSFSGSFKQIQNTLSIGTLIATQRYCEGERGTIEKHFMKALSQTKSIQNSNDGFKLLGEGGLVLLQAEKIDEVMNTARGQQTFNISYKAFTRGAYKWINLHGNVLTVQNKINAKPKFVELSEKQLSTILEWLQNTDLETLKTLNPPSKEHQSDGALSANLNVEYSGNSYQTPTFDHGNPPIVIKSLVDKLLSLSEKVE